MQREIGEELGAAIEVGEIFGVYQHAYTHFRVTLHAFLCDLAEGEAPRTLQVQEVRWVNPEELANYPMGKIDRQIAEEISKQMD